MGILDIEMIELIYRCTKCKKEFRTIKEAMNHKCK